MYDHSAEKLIAALLEDTLPPDLVDVRAGNVNPAAEEETFDDDDVFERRNIFDDDEMDLSRVVIGKNR